MPIKDTNKAQIRTRKAEVDLLVKALNTTSGDVELGSSLLDVQSALNTLTTAVNEKAAASAVDALSTTVDTKVLAVATAVDALTDTVSKKATITTVDALSEAILNNTEVVDSLSTSLDDNVVSASIGDATENAPYDVSVVDLYSNRSSDVIISDGANNVTDRFRNFFINQLDSNSWSSTYNYNVSSTGVMKIRNTNLDSVYNASSSPSYTNGSNAMTIKKYNNFKTNLSFYSNVPAGSSTSVILTDIGQNTSGNLRAMVADLDSSSSTIKDISDGAPSGELLQNSLYDVDLRALGNSISMRSTRFVTGDLSYNASDIATNVVSAGRSGGYFGIMHRNSTSVKNITIKDHSNDVAVDGSSELTGTYVPANKKDISNSLRGGGVNIEHEGEQIIVGVPELYTLSTQAVIITSTNIKSVQLVPDTYQPDPANPAVSYRVAIYMGLMEGVFNNEVYALAYLYNSTGDNDIEGFIIYKGTVDDLLASKTLSTVYKVCLKEDGLANYGTLTHPDQTIVILDNQRQGTGYTETLTTVYDMKYWNALPLNEWIDGPQYDLFNEPTGGYVGYLDPQGVFVKGLIAFQYTLSNAYNQAHHIIGDIVPHDKFDGINMKTMWTMDPKTYLPSTDANQVLTQTAVDSFLAHMFGANENWEGNWYFQFFIFSEGNSVGAPDGFIIAMYWNMATGEARNTAGLLDPTQGIIFPPLPDGSSLIVPVSVLPATLISSDPTSEAIIEANKLLQQYDRGSFLASVTPSPQRPAWAKVADANYYIKSFNYPLYAVINASKIILLSPNSSVATLDISTANASVSLLDDNLTAFNSALINIISLIGQSNHDTNSLIYLNNNEVYRILATDLNTFVASYTNAVLGDGTDITGSSVISQFETPPIAMKDIGLDKAMGVFGKTFKIHNNLGEAVSSARIDSFNKYLNNTGFELLAYIIKSNSLEVFDTDGFMMVQNSY